jgi:hypothetical protein
MKSPLLNRPIGNNVFAVPPNLISVLRDSYNSYLMKDKNSLGVCQPDELKEHRITKNPETNAGVWWSDTNDLAVETKL